MAAKRYTFAECRPSYENLWKTVKVTNRSAVEKQVREILKYKTRYIRLEMLTKVKWFVIAALRVREAGSPPDWKACLHNGQRVIGTGRKTTIVPIGKGPFETFESAAIDAIRQEGLDKIKWDDVTGPAFAAWCMEKFNGFGYRMRGLPSCYLWGATNHQVRGKFISDGKFSSTAWDTQIGGMAILKMIMELDADARFTKSVPKIPEIAINTPIPAPPAVEIDKTSTAVIIAGGAASGAVVAKEETSNYAWIAIPIILIVVALIVALIVRNKNNRNLSPKTD